jgi:hypothetical protein
MLNLSFRRLRARFTLLAVGEYGLRGVASIQNTKAHQGNGILLLLPTHFYCVPCLILHCRSRGSRNPGGLPRSMVSCFESRNREARDLPLDALLSKIHRVAEQLTRTVRGKAARLRLDG